MINFDATNTSALAAYPGILYSWLPGGKIHGHEYVCGSTAGGAGDSMSVNIRSGKWADFASDAKGGDPVSLYAAVRSLDQGQAARELGEIFGLTDGAAPSPRVRSTGDRSKTPIIPVPADAPALNFRHPKYGEPTRVWPYHVAGGLAGYAARFDFIRDDGTPGKDVLPITYCDLGGGRSGWRSRGIPEPRPLYRLPHLTEHADAPLLVCEGEKAADAAAEIFPGMVATTPMHGAKSPHKTDWAPVRGRHVTIWPDNDQPGREFAERVAKLATAAGAVSVRIVDIPVDWPDRWDLADQVPDGADTESMLSSAVLWTRTPQPQVSPDPPPNDRDPETGYDPETGEIAPAVADPPRFPIPLGYDQGIYYYLSHDTGQIEEIPAAQHTEAMLCHLASAARCWERSRFNDPKSGVNWRKAADHLRSKCKEVGIFDPRIVRGRGAWIDEGRPLLHAGNELIVGGSRVGILSFDSKYIYPRARSMNILSGVPLRNHESAKLAELCGLLTFESPEMSVLFAGWIAIAPVCSALKYRPHLWMSGAMGSGKTWIVDNILSVLLARTALFVSSKTTEAGIRGALRSDGLPVIFDEAETQNERDRERMQLVMDLARQSYSEDSASIIKGTALGGAKRYSVRSAMCFSSVNYSANQSADESRIIPLIIPTPSQLSEEGRLSRANKFSELERQTYKVITPDYAARLISRTMRLLPTIIANAEIYARALSEICESRRQGDTLGAAISGYASLHHERVVTLDEARIFVHDRAWVRSALQRAEVIPDHRKALDHLLEQKVRVQRNGISIDISMVNIIAASVGASTSIECDISEDQSLSILINSGIRIVDRTLWLARSHATINSIFERTPWGTSWPNTLLQMPGTSKSDGMIRFGRLLKRGIGIPLDTVLG